MAECRFEGLGPLNPHLTLLPSNLRWDSSYRGGRCRLEGGLRTHRLTAPLQGRKRLWMAVRNWEVFLTCINEDSIHVDFGTQRAQDKSTGWSEYQHREQDSWKKKMKQRLDDKNRGHSMSKRVKGQGNYVTSIRQIAWSYKWHKGN